MEENLEPNIETNNKTSKNTNKSNVEEIKENTSEEATNKSENYVDSQNNSDPNVEKKMQNDVPSKIIPKPKKELPIEKKPFQEFVNIHLIPDLIEEINQRGLKINNINLKNTNRPIAGDKCWVINCEIKDTCSFCL